MDWMDWQPIGPTDLVEFDLLREGEAARIITERACFIDTAWERTFAEIGMLSEYIEKRQLWKHVGCDSQNEWIQKFCPRSRSTWFDAKRRWKELADVPASDKIQMSRGVLITMQKLSSAVRKEPEVLEAARGKEEVFRQYIEVNYPNQCIETTKPLHLNPEKSQSAKIEQAIEMARVIFDCKTREEALEAIAVEFIQEHDEEYEGQRTA
ncbi:MAG TPA: hypothetical protein VN666_21745 [Nitrospira sp.]|nr:hypothetical protein [Nitrospira sp.]